MIKIYFNLDEGYLDGWSSTSSRSENEYSLLVEKDHEVLQNARIFKFEDGELIRDEERKQQLIDEHEQEQNKPSELAALQKDNEVLAMAVLELSQTILSGSD